jgi:Na+-translocating ferredoxin:NAD+ oxidoreductase subunit G
MAAKKESTFKNMVMTLFIITFVASLSLGYVYELTKGPIELAKQQKKIEAIKAVVPAFDNDPSGNMFRAATEEGDSLEVYPAILNGEPVGYAIRTFTKKGFSGLITLMVGFDAEGKIYNISVLEHAETPGLGDKMSKKKSDWSNQFNGKDPGISQLKVKQDGGEIDAITASTISSRAFCDAVERAFAVLKSIKKNQESQPQPNAL